MKHGGDLETYKGLYGKDFVDFSSNINPFGIPKELKEKIQLSIEDLTRYPDIQYRKVKKYLADYLGCSEENILVGNGVMELIDNAIALFSKVLLVQPSFIEYQERAELHGLEIDCFILPKSLKLDQVIEDFLERIQNGQLVILANPNNPTGFTLKEEDLLKICHRVEQVGAFLVLDEAFYEFTPQQYDSIKLLKENYSNVFILRAATKFFALPGIRLGYGVCQGEFKGKLERRLLPWNVNTLAMEAGCLLKNLGDYSHTSNRYFQEERKRIFEELGSMPGIRVFPSQANYVLLQFKEKKGKDCLSYMLENGYIIRTCSNYIGLDDSYIRFAIGKKEDNTRFLQILNNFLKG